jgi:hypothetical protein
VGEGGKGGDGGTGGTGDGDGSGDGGTGATGAVRDGGTGGTGTTDGPGTPGGTGGTGGTGGQPDGGTTPPNVQPPVTDPNKPDAKDPAATKTPAGGTTPSKKPGPDESKVKQDAQAVYAALKGQQGLNFTQDDLQTLEGAIPALTPEQLAELIKRLQEKPPDATMAQDPYEVIGRVAEEAERITKGEPKVEIEVGGKKRDAKGDPIPDDPDPNADPNAEGGDLVPEDKKKKGPTKPKVEGEAGAQPKGKDDKKPTKKDAAKAEPPPTSLLTVPAVQFLKWDQAAKTVAVYPDIKKQLEGKVARHADGLASAIDDVTTEELDRKGDWITINISVSLRVVELPAKLPKGYPWKIGDTKTETSTWQLNVATGKGGQLDFSNSIPSQFRALLVKTGSTYAVKSGGGTVKAGGATLKVNRIASQAERVEDGKKWVDLGIEVSVSEAAENASIVSAGGDIIQLKDGTTVVIPLSFVDQ